MLRVLVLLCLGTCAGITLAHDRVPESVSAPATTLEEAASYLEQFRLTGDDVWLEQSAGFFQSGARFETNQSPRWHYLRAWHAQAAHQFEEADRFLQPLVEHGRADVNVWLLQANLARITGAKERAAQACRRVLETHLVLGRFCLAQVHLGSAVSSDSLEVLHQLLNVAGMQLDEMQLAWAYEVLATLAMTADNQELAQRAAERAFELAGTMQHRVLLARIHIAAGQPLAALDLVRSATDQAPALLLTRLSAMAQLHRLHEERGLIDDMHHSFSHGLMHGDTYHAREMAEFYLDILPMPERARDLAVKNWAQQKEPEDLALLRRAEAL